MFMRVFARFARRNPQTWASTERLPDACGSFAISVLPFWRSCSYPPKNLFLCRELPDDLGLLIPAHRTLMKRLDFPFSEKDAQG